MTLLLAPMEQNKHVSHPMFPTYVGDPGTSYVFQGFPQHRHYGSNNRFGRGNAPRGNFRAGNKRGSHNNTVPSLHQLQQDNKRKTKKHFRGRYLTAKYIAVPQNFTQDVGVTNSSGNSPWIGSFGKTPRTVPPAPYNSNAELINAPGK